MPFVEIIVSTMLPLTSQSAFKLSPMSTNFLPLPVSCPRKKQQGKIISQKANVDNEVSSVVRLAKDSAAFGRLYDQVWNRSEIRLQTILKVCKSVVVPILLYGSETWTVYHGTPTTLTTVSLRKLPSIKWQDEMLDTEVLTQVHLPSIHSMHITCQLQQTGQVVCTLDYWLPKHAALLWWTSKRKAIAGWPAKVLQRLFKAIFESIQPRLWLIETRSSWQTTVAFFHFQRSIRMPP